MSLPSSIGITSIIPPSFIPFISILFIGTVLFVTLVTAQSTDHAPSIADIDKPPAEQDNNTAAIAAITEYASAYITRFNSTVTSIKLIDIRQRNDTRTIRQTITKQLKAIDPNTGKIRIYTIPREEERSVRYIMDINILFHISIAIGDNENDIVNVVMAVSRDHDKNMAVTKMHTANHTEHSPTADVNVRRLLTRGRADTTEYASVEAKRRAEAVDNPASPFVDLTADELALMTNKEQERHERLQHRRAQQAALLRPRTEQEINILSANLWNYNHWEKRLPLVLQELKRINADIICFQEVSARKISSKQNNRFMIQDLTENNNNNNNNNISLDDYEFIHEPVMGFQEGDDYVIEGLAIFSKFPIVSTYLLLLSRDENDMNDFHQRAVLHARILTPHGIINVMTTHMSLSERARARTVHEIGKYIQTIREPIILVGDMNSEASDIFILTLIKEYKFLDLWPFLHGLNNSRSSSAYTFNSYFPKSRIDYIFIKNNNNNIIKPTRIFIEANIGIHMTGLAPTGGVSDMKESLFPSDHMFLLGFMEITQDNTNISYTTEQHTNSD